MQVGFGAALRVPEFRALWLAEALSVLGDQVARVALALLVYGRTGSAALTALTYALTFVPAMLGVLLAGLADRYPRRTVLVVADAVRAVLAAAMAAPGLPLWLLWCLVGALALAGPPFKAAQLALLADVLPRGLYQVGLGLRQISTQAAQVAGFGLGGLLVTAADPGAALLADAATFAVSAGTVVAFVRPRPSARATAGSDVDCPSRTDRRAMTAVYLFTGMVGLLVVPEGIAAPYAAAVGAASLGVGLLMAADPVGSVLGGWWAAHTGSRAGNPAAVTAPAVLAGLPLVACGVLSGAWPAMVLWALTGALSTVYLIRLQAVVVDLVPDARRGTVMGRVTTVLHTSQGVAIVAAGLVAESLGPVPTVALSGGLASGCAVAAGLVLRAARPRHGAGDGTGRSVVPVTHADPPSPDGN
ncbi:MAG TPA: MFS transporter [Actinophytocola sp.]|nr:MFS transporter [Actinophytocola sp.]